MLEDQFVTMEIGKVKHIALVAVSYTHLSQVKKKDVLLSYPYESMEPFLKMIKAVSYTHLDVYKRQVLEKK